MTVHTLKIKRVHPDAQLPRYATAGAACFDVHAIEESFVDDIAHPSCVCRTGLAFEVPQGYVLLVYSRSGHGFKNAVRLSNSVGVIDSDYRGELLVKLAADPEGRLAVKPGDRIAQCLLMPAPQWDLVEVDELSATERGAGGFGSTGV